ncbi:DoxX-like protein [Murinocardiopsis flavida]|uniref:DoxX-like protein n=1 Tax=Murinocardiopsis flavida TaxID=645275 RepID=A0A2P8DJL9_9ACTN|nr:DoxX family membrane protein [Murinocardiopsis flavida]PSK97416.1 DoxX-like protein [Murinocardiopsis flavida]
MGIFRTQARRLLALPFLLDGVENLRNPEPRAEELKSAVHTVSARFPWFPDNPALVVRVQAATGVVGGTLLVSGRAQRAASLLLAVQAVPTLVAEAGAIKRHSPEARRGVAVRDLSLVGALLLSATEPKRRPPRVVYDAEHAVARVRRGADRAKSRAKLARRAVQAGRKLPAKR